MEETDHEESDLSDHEEPEYVPRTSRRRVKPLAVNDQGSDELQPPSSKRTRSSRDSTSKSEKDTEITRRTRNSQSPVKNGLKPESKVAKSKGAKNGVNDIKVNRKSKSPAKNTLFMDQGIVRRLSK